MGASWSLEKCSPLAREYQLHSLPICCFGWTHKGLVPKGSCTISARWCVASSHLHCQSDEGCESRVSFSPSGWDHLQLCTSIYLPLSFCMWLSSSRLFQLPSWDSYSESVPSSKQFSIEDPVQTEKLKVVFHTQKSFPLFDLELSFSLYHLQDRKSVV